MAAWPQWVMPCSQVDTRSQGAFTVGSTELPASADGGVDQDRGHVFEGPVLGVKKSFYVFSLVFS